MASSQEPELSSFGAGFSVKPEHDRMPVSLTVNPSGPIEMLVVYMMQGPCVEDQRSVGAG